VPPTKAASRAALEVGEEQHKPRRGFSGSSSTPAGQEPLGFARLKDGLVAYAGESTWEKEAGKGWGGRMAGRSDGAGSPVSGGARDTLEKGDWKRGICCSTTLEGFGR
jgi:hypothetical protein